MNQEIEDIKLSYYEYISNIGHGCEVIAKQLRKGELESAFTSIANFAEGLQWLLNIESGLKAIGYTINSRISEATDFMNEINDALEEQDFILLADLFEYEIQPIFSSASEWIFSKQ